MLTILLLLFLLLLLLLLLLLVLLIVAVFCYCFCAAAVVVAAVAVVFVFVAVLLLLLLFTSFQPHTQHQKLYRTSQQMHPTQQLQSRGPFLWTPMASSPAMLFNSPAASSPPLSP